MTLLTKNYFLEPGKFVLEFGVGKGRFIREYALKNPNAKFLGVEKVKKWVDFALHRINKLDLSNVKIIVASGEDVLKQIPPGAVDECYVLFPDPWPKRRHWSRRIIQTDFIHRMHGILSGKGKLVIFTDHKQYFEWIKKIIAPFGEKKFTIEYDYSMEFVSNYQVKYQMEGRPIYSVCLRKNS